MLDDLAELCIDYHTELGTPSVSVAVARHGEIVFAEAHGYADLASKRPATTRTAYLAASVTKPVIATAVLIAAQGGLLDLDAPIEDCLGLRLVRHRDFGEPSVRDVLRHRGGLGLHFQCRYADAAYEVPLTVAEMVERYGVVYTEPDSAFEYSNLGYGLLGAVLEKVSGRPLAEYVREAVCEPLGASSFHIGPSYDGEYATRYSAAGSPYPPHVNAHPASGSGWATAADFALIGQAHTAGSALLSPETRTAASDALRTNGAQTYGLGWFRVPVPDRTLLLHPGDSAGASSMLVVLPDEGLSFCVLVNQSGGVARERLLPYLAKELLPELPPDVLDTPPPATTPTTVLSGRWSGVARTHEGDVPLDVSVDGGEVTVAIAGTGTAAARALPSPATELVAVCDLPFPTADARVNSPRLMLVLRSEGEDLAGAVVASYGEEGDGRLGNQLSHWCELTRA